MFNTVPMTEVEISVSCKNLKDRDLTSKSDPMCVLYLKDSRSGRFDEIDRSERIQNTHNPEFARKFKVSYYFEEAQRLKFEMYDVDSPSAALKQHDFLGSCELTLGELIGAPGSKLHRQLTGIPNNRGSILLSAEEVGSNKDAANLQFGAIKLDNKDLFGKSDPFFSIYRVNADQTPIQIEVYDEDSDGGQAHDLIGGCQITFRQLSQVGITVPLINLKKQQKKGKSYTNSGQLKVMQCNVVTEYSFLDYIRGGTQIHFTVAVDFTASNGNPNDPNSLHFIHPHQPNQYMTALKAVGEICQDYDTDKRFAALGFGAKIPPSWTLSHEFFLNFSPTDPYCQGVEGILSAYRQCIMQVQLYGPTNFSPVIYHVAKFAAAAARDGSHYFVLLIITDGIISDIDQTIQAIIYASGMPMSIIIVGVGNEDFEAMEVLDADKKRLSHGGRMAERDIVQFVPFRKYQATSGGNWQLAQASLAKEVLKEVPNQLQSWMQVRGIKPRPPIQVDLSKMAAQPGAPASATDGITQQMGQVNLQPGGQQHPSGAPPVPSQSSQYPPQQATPQVYPSIPPAAGNNSSYQTGAGQQVPYGAAPSAPFNAGNTHGGAPPYPGANVGAQSYGAVSGAPYPGAQSGAPYPGAQPGAPYPGANPGAPPYSASQPGSQYPGAHAAAPYPGSSYGGGPTPYPQQHYRP